MSPATVPHPAQPLNPAPTLSNPFSPLSVPPPPLPENPRSAPDPSPSSVLSSDPPPPPPPQPLPSSSPASGAPPASSAFLPPPTSSSDLASPATATIVGGPDPAPAPRSGGPSPAVSAPLPHPDSVSDGRCHAPARLSYAQATRVAKGTGFVRSHAAAVENFAKIPRTSVNIICGSRDGVPSFSFISSDLPKVEEIYANALVMKFSGGRPSLEASHKEIQSWGMEHPFSIGPLTSKAFLIRFFDVNDLLKVLTRPSSLLISFPYKVFRWHNLCHLTEDSALAPVWISLPRLPLQCFIPEFLEAIGNKLGRFLCFDKATTTLARPSAARICVELDLRKSPPPTIWIGLFEGFKQAIIYERLPNFCNHCHMMGHSTAVCSKICTEALPTRTGHRKSTHSVSPPTARRFAEPLAGSSSQAAATPSVRPPPVRQNASYKPSANSKGGSAPVVPPIITNLSVPSHQMNADPTVINKSIPIAQSHTHEEASNKQQASPPHFQGIGSSAEAMDKNNSPHKPQSQPSFRKGRHKRKSVSFSVPNAQLQSNVEANREFWDAVNRQVAMIDQARIHSSLDPSAHLPDDHFISSKQNFSQTEDSSAESPGSSDAAESPRNPPRATVQEAQHAHNISSYVSDGEDLPVEQSHMQGHGTDEFLDQLPQNSRRNKRHPDQPLNVQLRVRKDPSPNPL